MPVFSRLKQKRASEHGRRMAAARWALDRQRRETLAAMDPIKFEGLIVRRIVVIQHEETVREATIYDFDSRRDAAKKLRRVLTV